MAIPVVREVGAMSASGNGNDNTPTLPTHAADDILLIWTESVRDEDIATPSGWGLVTNSYQQSGLSGSSNSSDQKVFWKRATSDSETAPTFPGTGKNHMVVGSVSISGCITTGDPWDVTNGGVSPTEDVPQLAVGTTTTVNDCLIVIVVTTTRNATGTDNFADWVNANLSDLTEIYDAHSTVGGGGGTGVATGGLATAGAIGDTAFSSVDPQDNPFVVIALKPPAAAGGREIIGGARTVIGGARTVIGGARTVIGGARTVID